MRLIVSTLILTLWLPSISAAREVRVRSGEHENFSRLVIYTNTQSSPTIDRTGQLLQVKTGDPSDTFTFSGVFDFIPKTRITSVSANNSGELLIETDCQCSIATEILASGLFVIDVVDNSDPQNEETPDSTSSDNMVVVSGTQKTSEARFGLPVVSDLYAKPEIASAVSEKTVVHDHLSQPDTSQSSSHDILDENKLLTQLARAASQGLLSPNLKDLSRPLPADGTTETDIEVAPLVTTSTTTDHLKVQTVVDRDMAHIHSAGPSEFPDAGCLPDASFSVAEWGEGQNGQLDFSFAHSQLVTEFDTVDSIAFLKFLRHQVYLTLGAETIAQLNNYVDEFPERENLTLIANVMANTATPDVTRISSQITCDGPVALWAVLSIPRLPREAKPNTAAIVTEFSALPRHLRAHLGPMLMRKYLSIGDTDTAMEINRITERGAETRSSAHALSDAHLSLATDDLDEASTTLTKIVDSDDQNSVEAVLLIVESSIENQVGIPDRILELLASLGHEHQKTRDGYRLALAEIDALTHMSRFNGILDRLAVLHEFPDMDQADHDERIANLGNAAAQNAANATFLRLALGGVALWTNTPDETRIAIADRLIKLGFTNHARMLLSAGSEPPSRAARLLIASAALSEGKAKVALGYLAGLNTDAAQELRQLALSKTIPESTSEERPGPQNFSSREDLSVVSSLAEYRALIGKSEDARAQINAELGDLPSP